MPCGTGLVLLLPLPHAENCEAKNRVKTNRPTATETGIRWCRARRHSADAKMRLRAPALGFSRA